MAEENGNGHKSEEELKKFLAEAKAQEALAVKYEREADLAAVSARKTEAEALKLEHESIVSGIQRAKAERDEVDTLAGNKYHHVYPFNESVGSSSVKSCIDTLTNWMRTCPQCDVEIVFNSPGGSVVDGMALYDYIQFIRRSGHKVTTSTIGIAASMAGILLQAGDTRVMGHESYLLIHEAAFGAGGKIGDVEDTLKWVQMVQDRILSIFATRAKVSKSFIKSHWRRKDWWMTSDQALKFGFVDEVR